MNNLQSDYPQYVAKAATQALPDTEELWITFPNGNHELDLHCRRCREDGLCVLRGCECWCHKVEHFQDDSELYKTQYQLNPYLPCTCGIPANGPRAADPTYHALDCKYRGSYRG